MKTKTKAPAKKTARPAPAKTATKKVAAKKVASKKIAAKTAVTKKPAPRADLGAPIDGFFKKQPAALRAILDALRELVEGTVPGTESSIKWGMPFYTLDGKMMCALGAHKSHVNLILAGDPNAFSDPKGLLEGSGKTGRHLKVTDAKTIPTADVRNWLKTAAKLAKS